jgi:predicted 3-demethylubiquinone-9 3-methyltransferase (glyoxalase superfamily)
MLNNEQRSATQDEVDHYWDKLGEGGDEAAKQCGWLADKFGVSWQIVPTALKEMMSSPDKEKAGRVTAAVMRMKKLDIAGLQKEFDG